MLRFVVLVGVGALMLGVAPASARGAELGLELSLAPGGAKQSSIPLALTPGAAEASVPIYLRKANGEKLEKLVLAADVTGAKVEIDPAGEQTLDAGGFLRYTVVAKDLTRDRVTATLIARSGSDFQRLADVGITRPPTKEALVIEGATNDGIVRTSDRASVRLALTIVNVKQDPVTDLRVAVAPFVAETEEQVRPEVMLDGKPNSDTDHIVSGNGVIPLDISGDLEAGGEWMSNIRLIFGRQTTIVPIKITRNRVAPTVVFDEVADTKVSVAVGGAKNVTFKVPVTENGGHTVDLQVPTLILTRIEGSASEQARYDSFTIAGVPGQLKPGESRDLDVTILGLKGAGEYSTLLRFRGAGGDPKDVTTKLWLRVSVCWALFVLFFAVVLGEIVRRLRVQRLAALRVQHELALLNDQLEQAARTGGATSAEQPVLDALRATIHELYNLAGRKPDEDIADRRTALETKLELIGPWLAATRDARTAGWLAETETKLRTVADFLESRTATDAANARAALDEVQARLSAGPGVQEAVTKLDLAVREWLQRSQAHADKKQAVTDALAEAKSKLRAGAIADARKAYDDAAAKLAEAAAAELLALTVGERPPNVEQAEWDALKAELTQASNVAATAREPGEAIAAYRKAYARYLTVVVTALRKVIVSRHQALKAEAGTGPAPAQLQKLNAARKQVDEAIEAAQKGEDLASAHDHYEAARKTFEAEKAAGRMGAADAPGAVGAALDIPTLAAERGATPKLLIPTGATVNRQRRILDWTLTVIAAAGAAVSGLLLLYYPDAAWGSTQDFFIAGAWGAGIHTIANAMFQSVPTVLGRFGAGASTP